MKSTVPILVSTSTLTALAAGVLLLSRVSANEDPLRKLIDSSRCPGFVSYVRTTRGEIWNAIGLADAVHGEKMTPDTVFFIASMSKSFCGVLAAQAIDEGRIALDTPVASILPEFADLRVLDDGRLRPPRTALTFRHCLSMTGGLTTHSPYKGQHGFDSLPLREEARQVAAQPLSADPGTRFGYGNSGIDIAAALLEEVTGRPYAQLLEERILRPLEMRDTTFFPSDDQLRRLAVIYELHGDAPCTPAATQMIQRRKNAHVSAAAGLYSTARDLAKFYQMLANRGVGETNVRILSENAFRLLQTRQTPRKAVDRYSLGLALHDDWLLHCGALCTLGAANPKTGDVRLFLIQLTGHGAADILQTWQRQTMDDMTDAIGSSYNLL